MRALALSLVLAGSTAALAAEEADAKKPPVALAAVKAGGVFPQVLGKLSSAFTLAIEGDWISPLLDSSLAVEVELTWSEPTHSATVSDPRVPDASYSYTITERTLGVFLGPKYFILPVRERIVPWAALGVRFQFLDSQINGQATADFGQNDETGTHVAFGAQAGCGYRLGPGLLALELQFVFSPIEHLVTGPANVGDLAVRLAYAHPF